MKIIRSVEQMQRLSRSLASSGQKIGLVPTMGYLHEGHLSLIKRAKKLTDQVITTIFVNPAQFSPNEDLSRYPRDERGDLQKIRSIGGDIVFLPKVGEIYPADFETVVRVEELTKNLEGTIRPGHFAGVTTVVAKLFNITRPDVAVFGMKDFQQAVVLGKMTRDLGYPIKFVVAPTVREKDGVAMSSRNVYLKGSARAEARALSQALFLARNMVNQGEVSASRIRAEMKKRINQSAPTAQIDYISFNDLVTLTERTKIQRGTVCSLAVRLHGVRLIDNLKLR